MSDTPQPRKRRGKSALINPDELRRLIATGMRIADMAEHFDVSTNAIDLLLKDYGIRLTPGRPLKAKAAPAPVKAKVPAPVPTTREQLLIATGGRYDDLRAWAQRWGTTETKARQEWHALRLPVRKGGSA